MSDYGFVVVVFSHVYSSTSCFYSSSSSSSSLLLLFVFLSFFFGDEQSYLCALFAFLLLPVRLCVLDLETHSRTWALFFSWWYYYYYYYCGCQPLPSHLNV